MWKLLQVKTEVDNSVKPHTQANGANSTCEQGSQPEVWPIVVEYLDQPGQILVEVIHYNEISNK